MNRTRYPVPNDGEDSTVDLFTIGEAASRCGVTVDTLRFYERRGLVHPTLRSRSGYRLYDSEAVDRLEAIRRAQDLGFTLREIKDLLGRSRERQRDLVRDKREALVAESKRLEEQIAALDCLERSASRARPSTSLEPLFVAVVSRD